MGLDDIKSVTRMLLYVEPEPTDIPTFVSHPFFQSDFVYDGKEFFNLFDDVDRARKPYDELIDKANDATSLLILVRDPYKMLWFSLVAPRIDDAELYANLLKSCWIMEEWPSRDVNVDIDSMVELFKGADRSLMVPDLPDVVRVYRGVNVDGSPYNLSWTFSLDVARFFSDRFGEHGRVYELDVRREDVLAVINERNEAEVVVDARYYRDKVVEVVR